MPDRKFVAHCRECGHTYKVASETKVYPCKECGAEVVADVAGEELELVPEEHLPEPRSIRERHPHSGPNKGLMMTLLVVVVLAAGGVMGYAMGWFGFLTGAQPNFNKVTETFVEDWNTGDLDAIAESYHPSKIEEFRATLGRIQVNRGWESGMPKITGEEHGLTEGTDENPEQAMIQFEFTGIGKGASSVPGWGQLSWQFEPSRNRWYIFAMRLVPSPLEPQVGAFQDAWNTSDLDALLPFFKPKTANQMTELVTKWGKKKGWLGAHPRILSMEITGEEGARRRSAALLGTPDVLSEGVTGGDPLTTKWIFNTEYDSWYVIGFKSFP